MKEPGTPAFPPPETILLLQAILALVVFVSVSEIALMFLGGAGLDGPGASAQRVEAGLLAAACSTLAVWALAWFWRPAGRLHAAGGLRLVALSYPLFLLVWAPIAFVLYPRLLEAFGQSLAPQEILTYFTAPPASAFGRGMALLVVCVLGPLGEELVFRGYLQGALSAAMPRGLAVVLASLVFGLMHGASYAFPVGLLGVFFGVLKERHRSLTAPVLAHMLHNSVTIGVTMLYPQAFEWLYGR